MAKITVKKGDLFKQTYGCTMHRCSYYQVIDVFGDKVFLGHAQAEWKPDGYDSGHIILIGRSENPEPVKRAKITWRGLKECKPDSWNVKDHYWDYLKPVEIGHSEYTYGD